MGCELLLLLLLLRYSRSGLTFSPTNIISPFSVTYSYKQPQTPAFKLSKYVRIIDFPPRRVVVALSKVEAGSIPPFSRWAKKKKSGWFFFYPLCPTVGPCNNIQGVILSQQNHLTSRWQRQGERLHPPWCPLTPGTDPSGSAGLARRSRSVPAPRRTW